jgi:hypothetical protein
MEYVEDREEIKTMIIFKPIWWGMVVTTAPGVMAVLYQTNPDVSFVDGWDNNNIYKFKNII